jgi:hypothetical protein
MSHHVVADFVFVLRGGFVIDVGYMLPELRNLFVGNWDAKFLLALGEGDPESAPGGKFISSEKICCISG